MTLKTTLTPAEHANVVQGMQYETILRSYSLTAPSTSKILAATVIRKPAAIKELVVNAGVCGTASATLIDLKKNGTTVLSTPLSVDNADADGITKIALPDTDVLATCAAGDVITIETGSTVATAVANLSCECRIAQLFT